MTRSTKSYLDPLYIHIISTVPHITNSSKDSIMKLNVNVKMVEKTKTLKRNTNQRITAIGLWTKLKHRGAKGKQHKLVFKLIYKHNINQVLCSLDSNPSPHVSV